MTSLYWTKYSFHLWFAVLTRARWRCCRSASNRMADAAMTTAKPNAVLRRALDTERRVWSLRLVMLSRGDAASSLFEETGVSLGFHTVIHRLTAGDSRL